MPSHISTVPQPHTTWQSLSVLAFMGDQESCAVIYRHSLCPQYADLFKSQKCTDPSKAILTLPRRRQTGKGQRHVPTEPVNDLLQLQVKEPPELLANKAPEATKVQGCILPTGFRGSAEIFVLDFCAPELQTVRLVLLSHLVCGTLLWKTRKTMPRVGSYMTMPMST